MSKINELIKKWCPNGVEYRRLEKCCNILDNKRKPVKKGAREKGEYPYYGANGIQDYVSDYIFDGKFVLVGEDGSVINDSGNPIVNWAEGKIWVNNHAHIIEEIDGVSLRYLFHYIQTIDVTDLIHGNIPKLNQGDFKNLNIAIPPMQVQEEIARILDRFSELETELETELEIRQEQYEYWRSNIFDKDMEYYRLDEICDICAGGTPTKSKSEYWNNGSIKWLGSTVCKNQKNVDDVTDYITELGLQKSSAKLLKKETTLIAMVGATIGKVAFLNFEACTNQNVAALYPKDVDKLNTSYLYYACSNLYEKFLDFANGKFAMASLSYIKSLEIPVPSIKEQEKIVNILDKFEKLTKDISEGLPAEIQLRRKQYEYYRNKLLNFEELK